MNSESCPKCGTAKVGESCQKCGLVFERFNPDVLSEKVPATIQELWEDVEWDWENKQKHALLLEQALINDAAGYIAGRYRDKDDDISKKQLERITSRLIMNLESKAMKKPSAKRKWSNWVYVLLFLVVGMIVFMFFLKMNK